MTYEQSLEFLFSQLPVFERQGESAYKPGLETTRALAARYGSPQEGLKMIHVAGTNGKGSVSSTIASVLTAAGYRTGLYTSPHLVDFGERICVDGHPVERDFVVEFVESWLRDPLPGLRPTFFEFATVMAFCWFRKCAVDVAVIETGLGGRLDSTNIITPLLSVITNISPDHTHLLGNTPAKIAAEKGGIIKEGVPTVIGQGAGEVRKVFESIAHARKAPIVFAADHPMAKTVRSDGGRIKYEDTVWGDFFGELRGEYQKENGQTVLAALAVLSSEFDIPAQAVRRGFGEVSRLAGLRGRWMELEIKGHRIVCDTGHNVGAWEYLGPALRAILGDGTPVEMVVGFVADKDLDAIVPLMPRQARYWAVAPSTPRARSAESTAQILRQEGLQVEVGGEVGQGAALALGNAAPGAMIYIGGSTFVVADFLKTYQQ